MRAVVRWPVVACEREPPNRDLRERELSARACMGDEAVCLQGAGCPGCWWMLGQVPRYVKCCELTSRMQEGGCLRRLFQ